MLRRVTQNLGRSFTTITAGKVKTQAGMFTHLVPSVIEAVRNGEARTANNLSLTKGQIDSYIGTVGRTLAFLGPTNKDAPHSAFPLQLADSLQFFLPQVGLVDRVLQQQGHNPNSLSNATIKEKVNFISYYRSIPSMEELQRLGITYEQACEIIAKQLFMGGFHGDKSLNSNTVNLYFPSNSHMLPGSNDLGTTSRFLFAESYARGLEGQEMPFTIVNGGDTTAMTNGFHSSMKFLLEANKKEFKAPVLFLIQSNGRSISSVLNEGAAADAFRGYGKLFSSVCEVDASNHEESLYKRDQLIDTVLRTNRPAALVLNGKRIGGHATDSLLGTDEYVVNSFNASVDAISNALLAACTSEYTPAQLADALQSKINTAKDIVEAVVNDAKTKPKLISFSQARELTVKGSKETDTQGSIVTIPLDYWTGKGSNEKTKSGAAIFGESINTVITEMENDGVKVRVVHQENSNHDNTNATLGVYDQYRSTSKDNLRKFISIQLDEQFQATLAGAFASIEFFTFNFLPHTFFAASQTLTSTASVAYREFETGRKAAVLTVVDAGSLTYPDGKNPLAAKLGFHHNDQGDPRWVNPNTVCVIPANAEHFRAMLKASSKIVLDGRSVVTFFPTASYPLEHKQSTIPSMSPFDVIKVEIQGYAPKHGRKVVVVTGGFITKDIIASLNNIGMATEVLVMGSSEPSKALTEYLKNLSKNENNIDLVVVDPSPRAAFLGPLVNWTISVLKNPLNLRVLHSTTDQVIIPYGAGNAAFVVQRDFVDSVLKEHGMIETEIAKEVATDTSSISNTTDNTTNIVPWYLGNDVDTEVTVSLIVGIGKAVKKKELLGTIENGKSTVEIEAHSDGVVSKIYEKVKPGETFTLSASNKVSIIDIEAQNTTIKEKETPTKNIPSNVITTPLSTIERAMAKSMAGKVFGVSGYIDMKQLWKQLPNSVCSSTILGSDLKIEVLKGEKDKIKYLQGFSKTLQIAIVCSSAILEAGLNIKISKDGKNKIEHLTANIGLAAMTPKHELVVLVLPSAAIKSATGLVSLKPATQIKEETDALLSRLREGKLKPEDTDLEKANVCLVVSSLGKNATVTVNPVLPPSCTAILGIGAENKDTGKTPVTLNCCHATYSGKNAADLLDEIGVTKDDGIKSFVEKLVDKKLEEMRQENGFKR